jgi:hypothetical protein
MALSDEIKSEVMRRRKTGEGASNIARSMSLTKGAVSGVIWRTENAHLFGPRAPLFRKGEANPNAKLNEAKVREIRARRLSGERGNKLAAEFGVHESLICLIMSGKRWPETGAA